MYNTDLFCSGHAYLPDGRILVAGGHDDGHDGSANVNIFNPVTKQWTSPPAIPVMNGGRVYPTVTTLWTGDLLVSSGDISPGIPNRIPQVWETARATWRDLGSAQKNLTLHPWMYSTPQAGYPEVFYAGEKQQTLFLDTRGSGEWTKGPASGSDHDKGSSVMYAPGKIMILGGRWNRPPGALSTVEVIDLTAPDPRWTAIAPMATPRYDPNVTILADGKIFVTGGVDGTGNTVLDPEMWDPATGGWTTLAHMPTKRAHHSTAVLLRDGRVLTGGGQGGEGENPQSAEIYSPPYLASNQRPTIASAPSAVRYGQLFTVSTPNAQTIERVTWIRLSSVTHGFNANQRVNFLTIDSRGSGTLSIRAPLTPQESPPGPYMLFILNNAGTPSVAKVIQIQ